MTQDARAAAVPNAGPVCEPLPPVFTGRWFCAALLSAGGTFKQDAESTSGYQEVIGRSSVAWIDCRTNDLFADAPRVAAQFGFSEALLNSLTCEPRNNYEDFDSEMGLKLPSVKVRGMEVESHPLLMLIKRNFILTIHPVEVDERFTRLRRYSDVVLKKISPAAPPEDRLTLLLMRIIDENNDSNFGYLRKIEERGDMLNQALVDPKTPRETLAPKIYEMKHALIVYMDSLWDTVDVLNTIRYGDAELITNDDSILNRIGVLADKAETHISLSEHMSDVLASGLEVMQTLYNNQLQILNNRMALIVAYLTILGTALLVPNTLATIFGVGVFDVGPQDMWWFVTLLVVSTVAATWASFWWVRKRGWIPRNVD